MEPFENDQFIARLLDKNNPEELRETQKLRYDFLVRAFDPSLPEDGIDDDGFDELTDSILVIEKATGAIVGTYRLATAKTMKGHRYKTEEEFDIDALKADPDGIVELGRAVVHPECKDPRVIGMLWKGLFDYAKANHVRYFIGTCSLHGVDPTVYNKCWGYLREHALNTKFNIRAAKNAFEFPVIDGLSLNEAEIPSLLKGYLLIGGTISLNGYIDPVFKSTDVLVIADTWNLDERRMKFFLRF